MWEYRYTDELYHASHKYTRKWYANGYWHYEYGYGPKKNLIERAADKIGFDEKVTYQQAKKVHNYAKEDVEYAEKAKRDPKNQSENVQTFINGTLDGRKYDEAYARGRMERAKKAYEATPIYKIDKAVEKGKAIVDKVLNKIKRR